MPVSGNSLLEGGGGRLTLSHRIPRGPGLTTRSTCKPKTSNGYTRNPHESGSVLALSRINMQSKVRQP